jgi:putative ABC transport system permease protein
MYKKEEKFSKLISAFEVLAIPVAWYISSLCLESFVYKTTINWWIFALAGGLITTIALATVSYQTNKASVANPVEALRYE